MQAVKVWTVVNAANEFILISGDQKEDRQLGLLCFSEDDAASLLSQVCTPRNDNDSRRCVSEMSSPSRSVGSAVVSFCLLLLFSPSPSLPLSSDRSISLTRLD